MNAGTVGMKCSCDSSKYRYGHVFTDDLSIIRDVKFGILILKEPMYREQNNVNWSVNLKNCKAAVSRYVRKWADEVDVDVRVLRDWEKTVHECIEEKVKTLRRCHINRRKKHVLKSRVHLEYLNYLHENYVLVPADKASKNILVAYKK